MSEDTYLKDNIKKCVDYLMNKNDEDKRRIITDMFEYNDYLLNEQLVVQALNDKEKLEWFNNEMFEAKDKEIERLNKKILTLEETIRKANNNVLKDISMIKTHEMIKQEIVQRLFETSKILESGSDKE